MIPDNRHEIDNLDPDLTAAPFALGNTAEIYDSGGGWVVKLFPFGTDKEAAFNELDALKTAHQAGISVPTPGDLVLMKMRWGFAMQKVDGSNGMDLIKSGQDPVEAGSRYAEIHFGITQKPGKFLPDLKQSAAEQIKNSEHLQEKQKEELLAALSTLPGGTSLLHGDFHPGNVIWSDASTPVFVDWMNARQGNPAADVARSLVLYGWETQAGSSGNRAEFTKNYLARWEELAPGISQTAFDWLPIMRSLRLDEPNAESREELLKLLQA